MHAGVAHGTLRLTPGGSHFGTIVRSRLRATLSVPQGCPATSDRAAPASNAPQFIEVTTHGANRDAGSISWGGENGDLVLVDLVRPGRVRVKDEISVRSKAFKLTESADLSTATFIATSAFLSGIARYTATQHQGRDSSTGTVTGNLTALFDTPGPESLVGPAFDAYLSG